MEITQDILKDYFDYKDGFLYRKIKIGKSNIGDVVGTIDFHKRRIVVFYRKNYKASRLIFMWHHGYFPYVVDHINRDTLDDRIENLRPASRSENNRNSTSRKNSTSKYLGVHLRAKKYWMAYICLNRVNRRIGVFKTEELAALAYNREAVRCFKEFANLNIIEK